MLLFKDDYNVSIFLANDKSFVNCDRVFQSCWAFQRHTFIAGVSKMAWLFNGYDLVSTINQFSYSKFLLGLTFLGKKRCSEYVVIKKTGLIEQPLNLLYTEFAIIIGSVYLFFTDNDYDLSWGYGKH